MQLGVEGVFVLNFLNAEPLLDEAVGVPFYEIKTNLVGYLAVESAHLVGEKVVTNDPV